jgi:hypothetical protein
LKAIALAALAAGLVLGTPALAGGHGGGHGGGGHGGGGHGPGGHFGGGGPHFGGGGPHFGGGGRGGHFWHGRFWGYGIGPCWRLTPYGEYVWVCY